MTSQPSKAGLPPRPRPGQSGGDIAALRRSSGGDGSAQSTGSTPRRGYLQSPVLTTSNPAATDFHPRAALQGQSRPFMTTGHDLSGGGNPGHPSGPAGGFMPPPGPMPRPGQPPFQPPRPSPSFAQGDQGHGALPFYGGPSSQPFIPPPHMQHPQQFFPTHQPPQPMAQQGYASGPQHLAQHGFPYQPQPQQPMPPAAPGYGPGPGFISGPAGPPHAPTEPSLYPPPPQPSRGGPSSPRHPQPRPLSSINVARQSLALASASLPTLSKLPRMPPMPPLESFLSKETTQPDKSSQGIEEGEREQVSGLPPSRGTAKPGGKKVLIDSLVYVNVEEEGEEKKKEPLVGSDAPLPPVKSPGKTQPEAKDSSGAVPKGERQGAGQSKGKASGGAGDGGQEPKPGQRGSRGGGAPSQGGPGGASGGDNDDDGSGVKGDSSGTTSPSTEGSEVEERIRRLYAVMAEREERWAECVEALGFQPAEAWRVYRDLQRGSHGVPSDETLERLGQLGIQGEPTTSEDRGQAQATPSAPPREPPAPILGVRLLQQIDALRRENAELSGLLERAVDGGGNRRHGDAEAAQDADLHDAHSLIEALDVELTRSQAEAAEQRRRAEKAEEALRAACESQSRGWGE